MRPTALLLLGLGMLPASGCPQNRPSVSRHAGKEAAACDDGSAAACHVIGLRWARDRAHAESRSRSWRYFKMACEGRYAPACLKLRVLNETACADGLTAGCWNLGEMYRLGKKGIPADLARARRYFRVACQDGFARACYQLGVLWEQGGGGPINRRKARQYFRKACRGGAEVACPKRR